MEKKNPQRPSKKDLINALLDRLEQWQAQGDSPDEAIGKLTQKQYDFLIDNDVSLDALLLTTKQQNAITAMIKSPRICKASGYDKKYPPKKIELYEKLQAFLIGEGGAIEPKEKENFRNIRFTVDGTLYEIVFSTPRK